MRALLTISICAAVACPVYAQNVAASAPPPLTLEQAEALALQNNPTGAAAAASIEAARARAMQAVAWPNPVIGYAGDELTTDGVDPRGEHGIFVEQAVPLGGKLRLSRDVFQRSMERAEAVRDLQQLRILSSVRQTYYSILLVERRIDVQERLAAVASEAVGVTAQLFNVGAADRPDYLAIEIEARRVRLQLNRAGNDRAALRAQLAALTGARDAVERPLAGSVEQAVPELERDRMIRTVLDQSPALRAARAELARARAITARAQRETYPDLFLRGGAAYNREHGEHTGRAIGWEGSIEAGISIPLFNRNAWGVAAARADEARAQAEVTRLELALESRAASQFADYLTALRAAEAYRADILPRAEEAYRLYLGRYREMAAAYPQVLVAQRTLFETTTEYLATLSAAWRAALQLQALLADGGLDEPGAPVELDPARQEISRR